MTTIACVYRTGGVYTPEYVWNLQHAIRRTTGNLPFRVLTDAPEHFGHIGAELEHGWPGWWSKLELFRPGLFAGSVLYMDLDTLPVGDLSDIAGYFGAFALIGDFTQPKLRQSGVMAWTPGAHTERLWEQWIRDPAGHMRRFRGDGQWLHAHVEACDLLTDLYPGQIVSLKRHARKAPPEGARLVCAHGRPKFHDRAAGWAHCVWRGASVLEATC